MRGERVVPTLAPPGGWEQGEAHASIPDHVVAMAAEWASAKKRYPRASIASMSGLNPDRAAKLLDGSTIPKPSEVLALDGALGTDAGRLMPRVSHAYVQRAFTGEQTDHAPVRKTHALTGPRRARVDAWAARVAASGLTLAAIAEAAGLGLGRCMRILRQGAIEDAQEREALVDVLGEPSTAKSAGLPTPR